MDETNIPLEASQINAPVRQQKFHYKLALYIVLFILIIVAGLLTYLFVVNDKKQSEDQQRTVSAGISVTPGITQNPVITTYSFPLELISLTKSEKLNVNRTYNILWKQNDLEKWGNEIILCLAGFDSDGVEIPGGGIAGYNPISSQV